ncbi:hypothetical protein [Cupriavidus sp. EM10]|uniref:hypothetical protein n=1 Tax=Cupriavidus sp. EM10 TaxID=2839983 RepID=UPI001BFFF020|nr:hypothetical protein [Cupriavidus sp. EM10]QWE95657.1 hypothetical protein KLP38_07405 [Cupriavidus sp. EM10]
MSGGISATTAATIAVAASSALAAGAAIYGGVQQKNQAEAQAELTRRQAAQEQDAAVAQAGKIRKAARQQQAEATSQLAASGVSVGDGTPIRISQEIYKTSEQDAYQTILSGNRTATAGQAQAGLLNQAGDSALTGGILSGTGSLLSGAASAYKAGWKTPKPASTGAIS